jgi:osmotically-inducible protein OsmY
MRRVLAAEHDAVIGSAVRHLRRPQPPTNLKEHTMNHRKTLAVAATVLASMTLVMTTGCAVTRGQQSVGSYVDDSAITTAVKARFVDNQNVDAVAISVETLKGTVMLSGFARSSDERSVAESLAWKVEGVKGVKNEIAVRP